MYSLLAFCLFVNDLFRFFFFPKNNCCRLLVCIDKIDKKNLKRTYVYKKNAHDAES